MTYLKVGSQSGFGSAGAYTVCRICEMEACSGKVKLSTVLGSDRSPPAGHYEGMYLLQALSVIDP